MKIFTPKSHLKKNTEPLAVKGTNFVTAKDEGQKKAAETSKTGQQTQAYEKFKEMLLKLPCRIDNRLHPETLRFVVFILDETLDVLSLTDTSSEVISAGLTCQLKDGRCFVNEKEVGHGAVRVDGRNLFIVDTRQAHTMALFISQNTDFILSSESNASLRLTNKSAKLPNSQSSQLIYHEGKILIRANGQDKTDLVYYNEKKLSGRSVLTDLEVADQIFTTDYLLEKRPNQWKLTFFHGDFVVQDNQSFAPQPLIREVPEGFPEYRRSPRLNLEVSEASFELQKKEALESAPKGGILRVILPPMTMVGATVGVSLFMGRNPLFMIGMGMMSLVTAVFTTASYLTEKKERRIRNQEREANYAAYFYGEVGDIGRAYKKEAEVLHYQLPSPQVLLDKIDHYDARLYERMVGHKDFLNVSLGLGSKASRLKIRTNIRPQDRDENTQLIQQVLRSYQKQTEVPEALKLRDQTLGFVGSYSHTCQEVQNLLFQVAFFQSYQDVNFLALLPEAAYENDWAQWRFLPHFMLQELGMRGMIKDAKSRDLILNSFTQLLSKRQQVLREAGKERPTFLPHIVMSIFEDRWLAGHIINEFLAEDMAELGVTVIWVKEDRNLLPETVTGLVDYTYQGKGTLINNHSIHVNKDFVPYSLPQRTKKSRNIVTTDLEEVIRKLAGLHHVEVEKSALPKNISYLDLYKVKEVEELCVATRWQQADTSKTLAVPLGFRGKDDLVMLNLHERADGPHALAGGTTGAGKSELVQSYVLSLATNFAPEDVSFLIIDFKGGGMSNLFKNLPHLMGTITNLDGKGMDRAFASINAELEHRQKLFAQYGVNHINGYTKLYKQGKAETDPTEKKKYPTEPLPHLFLLMDEAREVKEDNPENMGKIDSIGRIGRSLGVHNLPSTQKPSGTFSDQFFANTKTKILLRVADAADSQEVLKTHDAAYITEPGQAYIQVGNNERYEMFQSAYSGAEYLPHPTVIRNKQVLIYQINDLGQRELLTKDLSSDTEVAEVKKVTVTELEAVVAYIAKVARDTQAVIPEKPWLPPLEMHYLTPETTPTTRRNLKIPLGLLDIPTQQAQKPYYYDLEEASHTAIYSSPGYGKSTTLQTIVMNLARQNSPEQVQFNLLDFGTNGLLPLRELPHVADIVTLDEEEKLGKMLTRIRANMKARSELFREVNVTSLSQYEDKTKASLPVLINLFDGYDSVRDDSQEEMIEATLNEVTREGAALGIYALVTANRFGAIYSKIHANIKTNVALFLSDKQEQDTVLGVRSTHTQAVNGRGQIKVNGIPTEIQIYLCTDVEDPLVYVRQIQKEASQFRQGFTGKLPEAIPMVSRQLSFEEVEKFVSFEQFSTSSEFFIGLSQATSQPHIWQLKENPILLVATDTEDQAKVLFQVFLRQMRSATFKIVFVDVAEDYESYQDYFDEYVTDVLNLKERILEGLLNPEESRTLYYFADIESAFPELGLTEVELKLLLKKNSHSLNFIFQAYNSFLSGGFDPITKLLRSRSGTGLFGVRLSEQKLVPVLKTNTKEEFLQLNEMYAYTGRKYDKLRLPMDMDSE